MDTTLKAQQYQNIIADLLTNFYNAPMYGEVEDKGVDYQLIIDKERNHYQILTVGWLNSRRIYNLLFHIDIKDGKVWVQEDNTDSDIVGKMEEQGIPASDIVLAFHSPIKRPLTGYAVG